MNQFLCVLFYGGMSILVQHALITPPMADDLLFPNSDFEQGTLDGWTAEGKAFAIQPTHGDNSKIRNRETSNLQGEWWIGGYERNDGKTGHPGAIAGDQLTGTLTSQSFTIQQPFLAFRIGGGSLPGQTGVRLLCDDRQIEMTSGVDSETMSNFSYDVTSLVGKSARLQIFDTATGGWGHINVDDFRGRDTPVPEMSNEFSLAGDLSASGYPDVAYDQPLRPQFHFLSRKNWLNDPNGMVFDGQKYHLFFQHNPDSPKWGNMTWGHATSSDMVHWNQHDHALLPYRVDRQMGTIFSGTAVVDHNNSLGKQVGDTKTMVAFYTFATQPLFYQAMAYSTDLGVTWTYWNEGRAVVPNQGFDKGERDPKVFWHEPSQRWVMALWVQQNPGRVRWFTSQNLVDWEFASDLMRDWAFECMDVVFLPVDGDAKNVKCVIYDASFDYEIGQFDGKEFHSETDALKTSQGNFYAAQSFNQAPNGRVVQMGWMRGGPNSADVYGLPHNQQMAFPCDLTLRTTDSGIRLFVWPIPEISSLVRKKHTYSNISLPPGTNAIADLSDLDLIDLEVTFTPGSAKQVVFDLPRVSVRYDVQKQTLNHDGVDDQGNPIPKTTIDKVALRDGKVSLRLLVDRLTLEAFSSDGESFAAHYIDPKNEAPIVSIHAIGGQATIESLEVRELESAWHDK
ncbi:Levanase precursor [Rubripirellula lacrimiformis]|uniref:Levanase n=1 Tax=Rubripirellula lacrimiformis TaxID=1930273 RepID=A0A517NCD7_9BACT|nr:glycoside hydrolase family 32 protein [Rubripirellula lacrimiformis]QDT04708.1 Levanase precursor [Rubripirellula lacrimiformis]